MMRYAEAPTPPPYLRYGLAAQLRYPPLKGEGEPGGLTARFTRTRRGTTAGRAAAGGTGTLRTLAGGAGATGLAAEGLAAGTTAKGFGAGSAVAALGTITIRLVGGTRATPRLVAEGPLRTIAEVALGPVAETAFGTRTTVGSVAGGTLGAITEWALRAIRKATLGTRTAAWFIAIGPLRTITEIAARRLVAIGALRAVAI